MSTMAGWPMAGFVELLLSWAALLLSGKSEKMSMTIRCMQQPTFRLEAISYISACPGYRTVAV